MGDENMQSSLGDVIAVEAVLDNKTRKHFGITSQTTYTSLFETLSCLFARDIGALQYRDEDNDLVCLGCEEELVEALKGVARTANVLRLIVSATQACPGNTAPQQLQTDMFLVSPHLLGCLSQETLEDDLLAEAVVEQEMSS